MRQIVYFGGKKFYRLVPNLVIAFMGLLLFLTLAGFSSAITVFGPNKSVVILDPGHGGYDPGAMANGLNEKDLNLAVALRTKEALNRAGIAAVMTREKDMDYVPQGDRGGKTKKEADLEGRISFIRGNKAEVCVSLHVNSMGDTSLTGAEVFFQQEEEDGKLLAQQLQDELRKIENMKPRLAKPGDFYLSRNTGIPTVIVELGYLSNPGERQRLQQAEYQEQLGQAIAKGIANYLYGNRK